MGQRTVPPVKVPLAHVRNLQNSLLDSLKSIIHCAPHYLRLELLQVGMQKGATTDCFNYFSNSEASVVCSGARHFNTYFKLNFKAALSLRLSGRHMKDTYTHHNSLKLL
eukprot:60432-Pelagomonas_calceolata.AAC.1